MKEFYAFFANLLLKYEIVSNDHTHKDIDYTFGEVTFSAKPEIPVTIRYRVQKKQD